MTTIRNKSSVFANAVSVHGTADEAVFQLSNKIAELEAENATITERNNINEEYASNLVHELTKTQEQVLLAQAEIKRLRDALAECLRDLEGGFVRCENCGDQEDTETLDVVPIMRQALAQPSDTSALDAYVAEKVKESHKVIPREGLVPHAYQLEATHNNAEYWYKWGHSEEAAAKGESVICMAQAVFAWRNAAYSKAEEVATLTKQRYLAVEELEQRGHSAGCRKNAFGDLCTCGLDETLVAIKESDGK